MADGFDNVSTLPPRGEATRGVMETLLDVLEEARKDEYEDVLIITRSKDGFLDFSMSSQGAADLAEMSTHLQYHVGGMIEVWNTNRREPDAG